MPGADTDRRTLGRATKDGAMANASDAATESLVGPWILLFPATYLLHIVEELWGGLPARMAELSGLVVPDAAFLAANVLFWVLLAGAVMFVLRRPSGAPLVVVLGTIVTINATLHLGGALLTASYSPGLVSGVLLWLPLGASALAGGHRALSERSFRSGVFMGVLAHVLVPLIGIGFVLALGGGWRAA